MEQRLSIARFFFGLVVDPFYNDQRLVDTLVAKLRRKFLQPPATFPFIKVPAACTQRTDRGFDKESRTAFDLLALTNYDPHLELVHVWCGLAKLNTYEPGKLEPTGWFGLDYADQFYPDLEIKQDECKCLLRKIGLPLPAFWYPELSDNTKQAVQVIGPDFQTHWKRFIQLGETDDDIEKWQGMAAATVSEQLEKEKILQRLFKKRRFMLSTLNGNPSMPKQQSCGQAKEPSQDPPIASRSHNDVPLPFLFQKNGDYWSIVFEGEKLPPIKDGLGLAYIACLLSNPHKDIHVTELNGALRGPQASPSAVFYEKMPEKQLLEAGLTVSNTSDLGPTLDHQARTAYKKRLQEIREDLQEAEKFNDMVKATNLREEMAFLLTELRTATGLGGKDRKQGNNQEKVRKAVTNRIRASLKKLAQEHPSLAQHLSNAINTGAFCSYQPSRPMPWVV